MSKVNYMVTSVFPTRSKWFHTKNRQNYDGKSACRINKTNT